MTYWKSGGAAMLRLLTTTAVGVGLLVASPSFAQTTYPNPAPSPAVTAVPKLDEQDRSFIKEAAAAGMGEVAFSEIAEKSGNPDVKRFAEKMVRDHTKANTELTAIASEAGIEMPKTLDADHQKSTTSYTLCMGRISTGNICVSWLTITIKQ
jgi:predicted outer membrane protein